MKFEINFTEVSPYGVRNTIIIHAITSEHALSKFKKNILYNTAFPLSIQKSKEKPISLQLIQGK